MRSTAASTSPPGAARGRGCIWAGRPWPAGQVALSPVVVDGAEGNSGPRPAELLVAALAGCTAMDVISILRKKRQVVEDYAVRVQGVQRTEHPAAFTDFEILHHIRGPVDPEAVRRAIELSATRYCSVGATLSSGLPQLRHSFQVERPDGLVMAEVCETGPYRSMGSIGEPVPA